ncbi:MAG: hypothetical protein VCE43_05010 [Myxococcota bacterium]
MMLLYPRRGISVFNRNLWIALPILGSIFPLRMLGATEVDIMNSEYVCENYTAVEPAIPALVVAGREHSLRVHDDPNGVFHAIGGARATARWASHATARRPS